MHASLSDIVADITANSIEAGAAHIELSVVESNGQIVLTVADNGKGMDDATQARAFNPFYTEPGKHDKRKIGMGLPFVKQTCDACNGTVALTSALGVGTTLTCTFDATNIDLPPMGDLAATVLALFNYPGTFELVFHHARNAEAYDIARSELAEAIGGFESVESLALAKEFLTSQEEAL